MSVSPLPAEARERVASLRRYQPGQEALSAGGKLSSNESPLGPAPRVREAIGRASTSVNRYPDSRPLRAQIAAVERVAEEQVIVTNGSDELCYLIAALFVTQGARIVLSDPCYQIDELVTRLQGGDPVFVPMRADGGHDLPAMARAAIEGAALVWLPTPHNPTGAAVDPGELDHFLAEVPETCLVVLDEAYRAYVDPPRRPPTPQLLARHPNLISQRTFSKHHALAGLRIGYGIASAGIAAALEQIKPPFNVNTVAIAAARAALDSRDWQDYVVTLIRRGRTRLERLLGELGVEFFPSQANFVTFRTDDVEAVELALRTAGLVARNGADLGLPGWLRVSVGAPPAMARLSAVLKEIL